MFLNMNILIRCDNQFYKFGKINQHDDGSLYIFLPTIEELGRLKKTSIHASGRVNFDLENKKTQFIEPLSRITKINYLFSIYVPSLFFLKPVSSDLNNNSKRIEDKIIVNINNFESVTVHFFLSPFRIIDRENTISFCLHDYCYLNCEFSNKKIDERSAQQILFYTARDSMYCKQLVDRYEAEKNYRNILLKTNQATLVRPNHNGEFFLHFSNVMARTPFLLIQFSNPDLYVDKLKGNKTKLKFVIKNKKKGNQIVHNTKEIEIINLILDAEFYEDGFIPEGYLKPDEI